MSTPISSPATSERAALVRAVAEQHRDVRGPLIPVLHEVVAEFGYIDQADMDVIADVLNLSRAEVHGVVSFYHDFRTAPPATHQVAICRAEACQAVGAQALYEGLRSDAAQGALGDAEVQQVFCLGNCALGPSGTVDGALLGRLTRKRVDVLTERWRA